MRLPLNISQGPLSPPEPFLFLIDRGGGGGGRGIVTGAFYFFWAQIYKVEQIYRLGGVLEWDF